MLIQHSAPVISSEESFQSEAPVLTNADRIKELKHKLHNLLKSKLPEQKSVESVRLSHESVGDKTSEEKVPSKGKRKPDSDPKPRPAKWNVWRRPPDLPTPNSVPLMPEPVGPPPDEKSMESLVCLELCAGSANLSFALHKHGFQSIPVDFKGNKHTPKVHCVHIDLTKEEAFDLIKQYLDEPNVFYVHIAPPCGTSSAARNKPMDPELVKSGFPNPVPLRSEEHPLGLPGLTGVQKTRVELANSIYLLTAKVVALCTMKRIIVSVENPARSLFWSIPFIECYLNHPDLEAVLFHNCMLGGERKKETLWLSTRGVFSEMALTCDGKHKHKPWTVAFKNNVPVFDTAAESEYPSLLCSTVASLLQRRAITAGYTAPATDMHGHLTDAQLRHKVKASVGSQARGRKLPQLVSEFLEVKEVVTGVDETVQLEESQSVLRKFIRVEKGENGSPDLRFQIHIVGTRRTPEEFLNQARQAGHPYRQFDGVTDDIKKALFNILILGPVGLGKHREKALTHIKCKILELEPEEKLLHEGLPPHLKKLLSLKKILAFKSLLRETGFADWKIVDEIMEGFDVVGKANSSGLLPKRLVPATITSNQLKVSSKLTRMNILNPKRRAFGEDLDRTVYDMTLQEVADGWLGEAMDMSETDKRFPNGWLPIPRFGLQQSNKVRLIDDGKLPGLNQALTTTEKLRLQDTDDLCALIAYVAKVLRHASLSNRKFRIKLDEGSDLVGTVNPEWGDIRSLDLCGRTLDLSAAYKNLGNSSKTLWACIISVWNPKTKAFQMHVSNALMFGSTASVYAFNRVAKALQHLAVNLLCCMCNQFFDDFPCVDFSQTACESRNAFESLLGLLGWNWASGEKAPPFSGTFHALGNRFEVGECIRSGFFVVANKESRIKDLKSTITSTLSSGQFRPSEASQMAGKLQYCCAQILGGACKPAVRIIRKRSDSSSLDFSLDEPLRVSLRFLQNYLDIAKPRKVMVEISDEPILIFTDGASEQSQNTWGAVIFIPGEVPIVAAGEVPIDLVDFWKAEVGSQIICQVELYPIVLVKLILASKLCDRRVLFYVDNDPTRDGLISGSSESESSRALLYLMAHLQIISPSFNWYARVPSFSNIADAPSRGKGPQLAKAIGASFVCDWKFDTEMILRLKSRS